MMEDYSCSALVQILANCTKQVQIISQWQHEHSDMLITLQPPTIYYVGLLCTFKLNYSLIEVKEVGRRVHKRLSAETFTYDYTLKIKVRIPVCMKFIFNSHQETAPTQVWRRERAKLKWCTTPACHFWRHLRTEILAIITTTYIYITLEEWLMTVYMIHFQRSKGGEGGEQRFRTLEGGVPTAP